MMPGWLKALLFVGGGVIAATGAAYVTGVFDPWSVREPAAIAEVEKTQPEAQQPAQMRAESQPQSQLQEESAESEIPSDGEEQQTEPQTAPKQGRLAPPNFDILRVEPDGSVVVAGTAPATARVEILHGDALLADTEASSEGEFVIVFDNPLEPGDYVLSLRATTPDGQSVQSAETAIVAVPETKNGQVLAMIEEPGAPAQLLTVPEAPADTAAGELKEEAPSVPDTANDAVAQQEAAAREGEREAELGVVDEAESEPALANETPAEQDVAELSPQEQAAEDGQPAQTGSVIVEAVEIEGDTIFVAGQADPGHTVRVYAGDTLLGDSRVSQAGRFLVEAKRDLPVGSYIIRADLLDADGSVVARAAVPFEREAGEAISAVAMQQPAQTEGRKIEDRSPAGPDAAQKEVSSADMQDAPTSAGVSGEGVTAPALQRVDGSVIIRRGDSLWRISRRVYGRGVRYSTIYLANQEQIRNPDLIWPGQVFTVPRETAEGEQADLEAISDQVVTP